MKTDGPVPNVLLAAVMSSRKTGRLARFVPSFAVIFAGCMVATDAAASTGEFQLQQYYSLGGQILDTPDKAADMARTLVKLRYGKDAAEKEAPFVVTDAGASWSVTGSRPSGAIPMLAGKLAPYTVIHLDKKSGALLGWELTIPPIAP